MPGNVSPKGVEIFFCPKCNSLKRRIITYRIPCRKYLKILVHNYANSNIFTKFAVPKFGLKYINKLILRRLTEFLFLKVIRDVTT